MLFVRRIPEKNAQKNACTLLQTLWDRGSHALTSPDRIWGLTQLRAMCMAICCSDCSSAGAMFLECKKKKQQNFRNCCWSVGSPPYDLQQEMQEDEEDLCGTGGTCTGGPRRLRRNRWRSMGLCWGEMLKVWNWRLYVPWNWRLHIACR